MDRRPGFRLPNALPMGSSRLSQLLRPQRSKQHQVRCSMAAEKTNFSKRAPQPQPQREAPRHAAHPLPDRLSTAQDEARESDVVIRGDEIRQAKSDGASASDGQAARAIIAGVQKTWDLRAQGSRGGSKCTRQRRTRRKHAPRRRGSHGEGAPGVLEVGLSGKVSVLYRKMLSAFVDWRVVAVAFIVGLVFALASRYRSIPVTVHPHLTTLARWSMSTAQAHAIPSPLRRQTSMASIRHPRRFRRSLRIIRGILYYGMIQGLCAAKSCGTHCYVRHPRARSC